MGQRREPRKELKVPVRIFGTDVHGKTFSENLFTVNVSREGAKLEGVRPLIKVGETIGMVHGQSKGRFSVKWVGQPGTAQEGQIGLQNVSPEKLIWPEVRKLHRTSRARGRGANLGQSLRSQFGWLLYRDADSAKRRHQAQTCTLDQRDQAQGHGKSCQQPARFRDWSSIHGNCRRGCRTTQRLPQKYDSDSDVGQKCRAQVV